MLLPLNVIGITWLITPTVGIEITSSVVAAEVRRNVPVHSTDAGSAAGQPAPFETVPPHAPNSGSPAAWLMTTFCPATVSVPTRVSPGFSATVNDTEPGPVWLAAVVIATNELFDVAVHAQVAAVLTVNVALKPAPDALKVVVDSE